MSLHTLVSDSAQRTPDAIAVEGTDSILTYEALDTLANCFAHTLISLGVHKGDRIGIWSGKLAATLVAMQGILRLGAIYIPMDTLSPVLRIRTILQDCDISILVTTQKHAEELYGDAQFRGITYLCLDGDPSSHWSTSSPLSNELFKKEDISPNDIAYILYTSGSTGKPKGVCISQQNALSFIDWAVELLQATPDDHFANHAPFHFDLSVFDIYVALKVGASVFLIDEGISSIPQKLVHVIRYQAITIWYSVPSVLVLMIDQGRLLASDNHTLRAILFAGEPFSIKHLRSLYEHWPNIRYLNFYGPTETNVCAFYELTRLHENLTRPLPIGKACCGDEVWAQKEDGTRAQAGEEGELVVIGPTVMVGYWGQPEHGDKPYATGDIVQLQPDGNYDYIGRRDFMVKVRGHRIEIGDVEAALEEHSGIHEAAVIVNGTGIEACLVAFIVSTSPTPPSLLAIKRHCAERLPRYMIIDTLYILPALPLTRNGKVDRIMLSTMYNSSRKLRKV